jgi:2-methylcitrate dehydratase PrpD
MKESGAMNITERLAHVIAETTYADLPAEAIEQGKRALLDTIGVTLAGYGEESAQILTAWVAEYEAKPVCTVLGSATGTSPALDAMGEKLVALAQGL